MIKIGILRGLGLGLIISSIIFSFNIPEKEKLGDDEIKTLARELGMKTQKEFLEQNTLSLTDEEIIAKANRLGMIFPDEVNDINNKENKETKELQDTNESEEKTEHTTIEIDYGMSSEEVSDLLFEKDLIEDVRDFNNYILDNKLSKSINMGSYKIKKDSTYEEIIENIALKR